MINNKRTLSSAIAFAIHSWSNNTQNIAENILTEVNHKKIITELVLNLNLNLSNWNDADLNNLDEQMKQSCEYIINHDSFVVVMDCDSTVIWSKKWKSWELITTWEWLTDAAFSLEKRLSNNNISLEVDQIAQETMSKDWAVFADSLDSRFSIFMEYWLTKDDVLSWATEAILADWFSDYIKLKDWLKEKQNLDFEQFFFLSWGFREMLETVLEKVIWEERTKKLIFSNEFKYDDDWIVTWWDRKKSLMYSQTAKKDMVEKLREEWKIPSWLNVSGLWDGSNDISMSDDNLFVAFTGVQRREEVVKKSSGVEAIDFYEASVFHTSPKDRELILKDAPEDIKNILNKWITSLENRIKWLNIKNWF